MAVLLVAAPAGADGPRLHGTVAGAKATGGHQRSELGFGASGFVAGELVLVPQLGLQLEVGHLWMRHGDPPADPRFAPIGDASSTQVGGGLRLRPFAQAGGTDDQVSSAGIWLSSAVGVSRTGGVARPVVDAFIGWDVMMDRGRFGIGPTLGWLHVFQPNAELRPNDANIALVGIHAVWDPGVREKPKDGDRDKDGLSDSIDKCPDDPEDFDHYADHDGCPDLDNDKDGVADVDDACPLVAEDRDGFEDEDGCPDPDNDKDGIADASDQCPNDPEDIDGYEDEDGCPETDNDKDGVADAQDMCPDEAETQNGYADDDGCPDSEQVRVVGDKIVLDDRVHFWVNSARIRPSSYALLERVAKLIAENPNYVHIEVQGHADERGPDWFNDKLSQDRAESVRRFLAQQGINGERLSAKGFGKSQPLVDAKHERAWFMNRRVEFKVTRQTKKVARPSAPKAPEKEARGGQL